MSSPNRYSKTITEPKSQGASQAMLMATGLKAKDLQKPQIGIVSHWWEGNPCNMHLNELAAWAKEGVTEKDCVGMRFNTIGVSDGISMGTDGMSFSLQSRDIIADSIETVVSAQWYDGLIAIPGCDKNMPGCMMAIARLNRPAIIIYGGTIASGRNKKGQKLDVVSAFQSYGSYLSGSMSEEERQDTVSHACPGQGACGGMYTANTMACAIEAMGLSLPYSSSIPAAHPKKQQECIEAGKAVTKLVALDLKPHEIMTKKAFENAITLTMVLGGSTNAVLHLIGVARSAQIDLSLDDFSRLSAATPFLADLKPSGRFLMEDLFEVGGTPAVLKYLLEKDLIHGDIMTVTGKTMAENLHKLPGLVPKQDIIKPIEKPISAQGHLKILKGNLAPEGAVAKITGKEGHSFTGPAQVYDSEEAMLSALKENRIKKGSVVVIRYEGPKGGPGMPEMLTPTSAIVGANLHQDVALITDGRFSGGSHGFIVGHITPEAQVGGPLALLQDGDLITIDAKSLEINVDLNSEQLNARLLKWQAPELKAKRGTLAKYIHCVASATKGCVTDEFDH